LHSPSIPPTTLLIDRGNQRQGRDLTDVNYRFDASFIPVATWRSH